MSSQNEKPSSIVVNGVPIVWKEENRGFTFFGIDSVLFWTNPSLISILDPLRKELGDELYSLLVAYEASKGTYEDYHAMITSLGTNFEEGFLNWGKAVSGAGWGTFSIISIDWDAKEAVLQIDNAWETRIFRAQYAQDNAPFLTGKISGIFSHAFKTNCRSEIIQASDNHDGVPRVIMRVRPSMETLEQALLVIQNRRKLSPQTEVRAMNSALRRNQQRLLDILDTIGEFIWETDPDLMIRYTSSSGDPHQSENLGKSLLSFVHPDDVEKIQELISALKSGIKTFHDAKVRVIRPNQNPVWMWLKVKALYDFSGNLNGFLGSGLNITSQVELEEQLETERQKSVQAAKMASLGEMAAGIAHELNNPLSLIVGSIWHLNQVLTANEKESTPINLEQFKETLSSLNETSQRMAKIIRGMRSFSRDPGKDPFVSASLESIIEETLLYCRARFENHEVKLTVPQIPSELKIECKPTQISQIILNFLNNSFDAVLPLPEKWIEIQVFDETDLVRFQITDSGNGIPKNIRDKILQPFFTTKEPGKGTGLGLSISNGIAAQHHGKIYLDENCGNTRFILVLPKRQR